MILSLLKVNLGKLEFLREWAYAGFFFLFFRAFLSHVFNQDVRYLPLIIFLTFLVTSYSSKKRVKNLTLSGVQDKNLVTILCSSIIIDFKKKIIMLLFFF